MRHGKGVFAIKYIPKNSHITTYGNLVIAKSSDVDDYTMTFPDGSLRSGDPDTDDPASCGHILNDYVSLWFEAPLTLDDAWSIVSDYANSINETNATFGDKKGNLIAARDIFPGEEITLFYGVDYWLSRLCRDAERPMTRFIALILLREARISDETDTGKLLTSMQNTEEAEAFITDFLCLHLNSGFWKCLGAQHHSATGKLRALYDYILKGGS